MQKKPSLVLALCLLLICLTAQLCHAENVALPEDPDYVDFSSDRSTVFINTSGAWSDTVFFDFFYPFDTSLELEYFDALIQYNMDHAAFSSDQGQWMIALSDLSKLYAPYFVYGIDGDTLTVRHMLVTKTVHPEDSGLRSPRLNYTKYIWQVVYPLHGTGEVQVTKETYEPFTTTAADGAVEGVAAAKLAQSETLEGFALTQSLVNLEGEWYVPVAEFMAALGKICTQDGDFLSIRTEIPDIPIASVNQVYTGWEKIADEEMTWADYMNGVMDGTIRTGHFWKAFYMGTETLFTGEGISGANDPVETVTINRIIPYNVYVPAGYDASTPAKLNIMLHGATGNENAPFERLSSRGFNVEEVADAHGYIVLCPNACTRDPQWYKGAARYSFFKALEMVCEDYLVDQDRIFLCGNSAGGKGTWDLMIRYPELFRACSVQAPAAAFNTQITQEEVAAYRERVADMPVLFVNGTADATIPFATATSPWTYQVAKQVINAGNAYYMTVEEGHHSYAYGSATEVMFDFFDRVLEGEKAPNHEFNTLTLTASSSEAKLDEESYVLMHATIEQDGITMIALSDLQAIYGPDFLVYDVHAYNTDPDQTVYVKLLMYNNTCINLKVGETFMRVDAELYEADVKPEQMQEVKDNLFPTRALSVPVIEEEGEVYVPAQEIMEVFGKTVQVN